MIESAVGDLRLSIEHVGSTAIPDIAAKPVIDMLAGIESLDGVAPIVPLLSELAYELRPDPEIPGRRFFRKFINGQRAYHLSFAEFGSRFYRETLCFRDHLRTHPELAKRYEALKQRLAAAHPRDRQAYLEGKSAFVAEVLELARPIDHERE